MDPLDALVLFTAGKMARRTLIVDSSHHTYNRYTAEPNSEISLPEGC